MAVFLQSAHIQQKATPSRCTLGLSMLMQVQQRSRYWLPVLATDVARDGVLASLLLFAGVRFPMEVHPNSIVIPPHEYRHVTLVFCPSAIQQYSATFEATVAGGGADPTTAGFTCELRGEGTLPSLSVQVRMRMPATT